MKRSNPGFQVDRANLRGIVSLEPHQLLEILVKNEILRRNPYCIWVEFSSIFGCKSLEMLFFMFLMIQEYTTMHFRRVTSVLTPKSENRLFLKKLASEDPFKGCPRRGTSTTPSFLIFRVDFMFIFAITFFKLNIFCSNFQNRQICS